jgi:hypothetical protein
MEDGLESSRVTLYEFAEKTAKKKELDGYSCLYTYKQPNGEIIIIASKDKAIEYSIKHHCCVEILNEKEKDIYVITNCVYSNGIFIVNK